MQTSSPLRLEQPMLQTPFFRKYKHPRRILEPN